MLANVQENAPEIVARREHIGKSFQAIRTELISSRLARRYCTLRNICADLKGENFKLARDAKRQWGPSGPLRALPERQ